MIQDFLDKVLVEGLGYLSGSVGVFKKKHGSAENDLMFFCLKPGPLDPFSISRMVGRVRHDVATWDFC